VGRADYIFALGVLAANFNELEHALGIHFSTHLRITYEPTQLIFARSDNALRIKIIQGCLDGMPYTKREKTAIQHFLRGYAICAENRNILLHSHVWPTNGPGSRTAFYKISKKDVWLINRYDPSITVLRAIADAMHAFSEYGSDLALMIRDAYWMRSETGLTNLRRPLPHKPPLPRLLVPKQPVDPNPPKER
jgi:hypothetical protein